MSVTDPRFMLGSGCECNAQSLPPQDEVSGLAGLAGLAELGIDGKSELSLL